MTANLYSHDLLARAAGIGRIGRLAAPHGSATAVSRVCGSEVEVDVELDPGGRVADFAQEVRACAVGQAAAAIVAEAAIGAAINEVRAARDAFRAFLSADGPPPDGRFRDLAALAPVRGYRQRHASAQLALKALDEAMTNAQKRPAAEVGAA